MRKAVWSGVAAAAAVLMMSTSAFAQQTDSKSVTVTAQVNAKARLDLDASSTSFDDPDPETVSTYTAVTPIGVTVKARTTAAGTVTLTVQASDDLKTTASDVIPIANLTWTASGLTPGTMSKASAVTLGSWAGPGTHSGTQTYKLVNSWSYVTGTYTTSITYTLTAP
jgi:hypothetical protein